MATPMTADQFVAALEAEGVDVAEIRSWRTHNRGSRGDGWGPVYGILLHHTASKGEASSVALCYDGYPELPGPLCHSVIGKTGTSSMVGNGRANHAGGGDPNVLAAVKDERYNDNPPATHAHEGSPGAVDGNARFYGAECINLGDGKDPWPPEQVEAMVRWATAICRFHGWSEKSVIGHKEWSDYKPDPSGPGMPTMAQMRARIKERLAHPPSWNPAQTGTKMPEKPNRFVGRRQENLTLVDNSPQTVYWTEEFPDDAGGHADGGKTVATNVTYSGVVTLVLTGLKREEVVHVYAAEEYADGTPKGDSPVKREIQGRDLGQMPISVSVPVNGTVQDRLVFKVVSHQGTGSVTVEDAWLELHTWPMS